MDAFIGWRLRLQDLRFWSVPRKIFCSVASDLQPHILHNERGRREKSILIMQSENKAIPVRAHSVIQVT